MLPMTKKKPKARRPLRRLALHHQKQKKAEREAQEKKFKQGSKPNDNL